MGIVTLKAKERLMKDISSDNKLKDIVANKLRDLSAKTRWCERERRLKGL